VKIFLLHDHKPPTFIGVLGSFLCHPSSVFLLFGAPKATSSVSFSSGVPFRYPSYFSFRLPIQLGSTKPPTIRRSSPIRNPPVHSFVNPIPVWQTDVCSILRTLESSQYPFLFSKPFVYKAPSCLDYPHANNSTKLEIFIDPPASRSHPSGRCCIATA